jgi:hypothetical protein
MLRHLTSIARGGPCRGQHHDGGRLRDLLGPTGATALVGGLIFVVLAYAVATQPGRCRAFVVTAVATGLVFTAVTSALAWGGPDQRVAPIVERGARYSTLPILLLDAALIVALDAYARRWWPRPKAIAAIAVLIAVLAAGWATDFRYAVRRYSGPRSAWAYTVDPWLRHCSHTPPGRVTVTFRNWWGMPPRLAVTFSCHSLRR